MPNILRLTIGLFSTISIIMARIPANITGHIEGVLMRVCLVGVPRMCRRFLKFAYVVVRVYGESLLTSGERGIQE